MAAGFFSRLNMRIHHDKSMRAVPAGRQAQIKYEHAALSREVVCKLEKTHSINALQAYVGAGVKLVYAHVHQQQWHLRDSSLQRPRTPH